MKKFIVLFFLLILTLGITGCRPFVRFVPPSPGPYDYLTKTNFDGIRIDCLEPFQDDNDNIVLYIEKFSWDFNKFKNLYIKSNAIHLRDINALGHSLDKEIIGEDEFFCFDTVANNIENYTEYYLILKFEKDTIYSGEPYSEKTESYSIHLYPFDIYINYYEDNPSEKQLLQFWLPEQYGFTNDLKRIIIPDIDEILQNTVYKELYLPFSDKSAVILDKQNIYYPEYGEKSLAITNYNEPEMMIGVRCSSFIPTWEHREYTQYAYNQIDFIIIKDDAYLSLKYYISFSVEDKALGIVLYSYRIIRNNIDEVKAFIRTLTLIT